MSVAVCIALALGLLDRVCKHRARRGLRRRGRFFELTHLENRGAAAGLLAAHPRWVLAFGCAVYALALALLLLRVDGGACLRYGAALLACGGLSNLVDRFARGSVTDYLRFPYLPGRVGRLVWNLADFMILAGGNADPDVRGGRVKAVSVQKESMNALRLCRRAFCSGCQRAYSIDLSDSAMLMRRRRKYITKSTIAANSTVSNSEYTTLIGAMRTSKAIMSTLICDMT